MKYTRRSSSGKILLLVILAAVTAAVTTLTVLAIRLHWFDRLRAWIQRHRPSPPFTCDFTDDTQNVTEIGGNGTPAANPGESE